jgi:ABC-type glycerol-3-phosphate transport system permease component
MSDFTSTTQAPVIVAPQVQKKPTNVASRVPTLLGYLGVVVFGLFVLVPFYFVVTTSFKTSAEATRYPIAWIPTIWTLDHYRIALQQGFPRALINAFIYAGIGTFLAVYVSALIGFVVVKFPSKIGSFLFWMIVASSLIPLVTYVITMVGVQATITKLTHVPMLNTYWGLIMPRVVYAFGVFMMRQAMLGVPSELLESARMDGASTWLQFRKIALAEVTPQTATLAVLIFMTLYGEFLWPLVATSTNNMQVLSVWIATHTSSYSVNPADMAAMSLLVMLPVAIMFLFGQRYIVQGVSLTGFK